jgi:hypothetical protein
MGLKGYSLWVMGQLDSNVQSPTASRSSASSRPRKRAALMSSVKRYKLNLEANFSSTSIFTS